METVVDLSQTPSQRNVGLFHHIHRKEYLLLWVMYFSYASLVLVPLALAVNLAELWRYRRADSCADRAPNFAMCHYRWMGTTALVGSIALLVAAGTFYYGVGIALAIGVAVWGLYRIARGMLALAKHLPPTTKFPLLARRRSASPAR